MNIHRSLRRLVCTGLVLSTASILSPLSEAVAQSFPSNPIRIVVPTAPSTPPDIISRVVAAELSDSEGWQVIVENKPGAGTNIAVKALIDSPPDGYTLMLTANSLAANMALYKPQPFDAERDVVPVALVGRVDVVAHVREAVRCGDASRAGRPRSGRGHTWRLSAARPCRPRPVRMGVQPEALAL